MNTPTIEAPILTKVGDVSAWSVGTAISSAMDSPTNAAALRRLDQHAPDWVDEEHIRTRPSWFHGDGELLPHRGGHASLSA
jgi:hypothetical protein